MSALRGGDDGGAIVLLTGPPGAGKSTVGARLARSSSRAVHLHADDFWHAIVAGAIPPYELESDAQNQTVLKVIAAAAFEYADGGYLTVVDGIIGPWMLGHVYSRMRRSPAQAVDYVVLRPGRDATLARAQERSTPGALTDRAPILAMYDQFVELGEFEGHVLDTSGEEITRTVERVAETLASQTFRLEPATRC